MRNVGEDHGVGAGTAHFADWREARAPLTDSIEVGGSFQGSVVQNGDVCVDWIKRTASGAVDVP